MEYGIDYKQTALPVDLIESNEGLIKVTEFDEIIPFTLKALLMGYNCTEDMASRVETESGITEIPYSPIQFFVTHNPHTFATCMTVCVKNIYISEEQSIEIKNEILDIVESLPGSLKRTGECHYLRRLNKETQKMETYKVEYNPPIFDMALRYLCVIHCTQNICGIMEESYKMVLYIPQKQEKNI